MRAPPIFYVGFLLFVSALALFGQTYAAPPVAVVEPAGIRPLPKLILGDKTFENVTLTGFDGKIVAVSHAYGVKDIPVADLSSDQIEALNQTSEKFKITLSAPPALTVPEQPVAVTAPVTNAPPSQTVAATNALAGTVPPVLVPVEDPAALALAAARTETMIQDFKAVGRGGNESEPDEDVPVRVPGIVRLLIWVGGSLVGILLIFFLGAGFLRRRGRKDLSTR